MLGQLQPAGGVTDWQSGSEQRLRISMVVATAVLGALLSLLQLPSPRDVAPLISLVVELTRTEPAIRPLPEEEVQPPPPPLPAEETISESPAPADVADETVPAGETNDDGAPTDWDVEREVAIRQVLDAAERESAYTVNPTFEAARQEASVRFRASVAPGQRHIWDNVEKDQLGRTILRDGNCWRVLDDPSAVNRWAFENFDRYVVYCDMFFGGKGKELPWVEVIRERYPYLRDPVPIP